MGRARPRQRQAANITLKPLGGLGITSSPVGLHLLSTFKVWVSFFENLELPQDPVFFDVFVIAADALAVTKPLLGFHIVGGKEGQMDAFSALEDERGSKDKEDKWL
jgi:hypothetical protein